MKNIISLILFGILTTPFSYGQKRSETFEFQHDHKTLRGLIEKPADKEPSAIVVIIPGYGRTDFVKGNWHAILRDQFTAFGLAVCFWDKMGCGDSEGEFDPNQAVQHSAEEAIAAIQALRKRPSLRSLKIGLWGISRAGWICPLIIEKYPIDFWISAGGTDDQENYGYLLRSNLLIHGKTPQEAEYLHEAWMKGHRIFSTGGTPEAYQNAIAPLTQDTLCRKLFGYTAEMEVNEAGRQAYYSSQKTYTAFGSFNEKSGLWSYIPDFQQTLKKVNCPVLAIFGEKDAQVDWRKTKALYEQTIGQTSKDRLTIKTFPQCNHSIQKCDTCAYGEDLQHYGWQACDGYYEAIFTWLKKKAVIN